MKTSGNLSRAMQNQTSVLVEQADVQTVTRTRKKYGPPLLTCYGKVRSLTLGPSPGIGESGRPVSFKPIAYKLRILRSCQALIFSIRN